MRRHDAISNEVSAEAEEFPLLEDRYQETISKDTVGWKA
jgi:hypothetical protein